MTDGNDVLEWRPRPAGRIAGVCLVIFALIFAIGFTISPPRAGYLAAAVFWLMAAAIARSTWTRAFRPYVMCTPQALRIQNISELIELPWNEVQAVAAGYWGLGVLKPDGTIVNAWAVQKSNYARWLHRSTRADRVAAQIEDYARARDGVSA